MELHDTSHWSVLSTLGISNQPAKSQVGAGQQWRHLMSVFYTSKELIDRGNSMGVNGKEGLSKEIVKAIIGKEIL